MLLSDPTRTIAPTLDGPVLSVLAATARPLSGRRVAALAGASHSAAIAVLDRLAGAGVVDADRHSGVTLYVGNPDHVAWPAVLALSRLRGTLLERLAEHLAGWAEPPLAAVAVGALASGPVSPPSPPSPPSPGAPPLPPSPGAPPSARSGEAVTPARRGRARPEDVVETLELVLVTPHRAGAAWQTSVHALPGLARRWTGNRCVLNLLDRAELDRRTWEGDARLADWRRDGIPVLGSFGDVLASAAGPV